MGNMNYYYYMARHQYCIANYITPNSNSAPLTLKYSEVLTVVSGIYLNDYFLAVRSVHYSTCET